LAVEQAVILGLHQALAGEFETASFGGLDEQGREMLQPWRAFCI